MLVAIAPVLGPAVKHAKQHHQWLFKCDCGKQLIARINDVRDGDTASCGCLRMSIIKEKVKKDRATRTPEKDLKALYTIFFHGAKVRKKDIFKIPLDFEQWKILVVQDCFYCGAPPIIRKMPHKTLPFMSSIATNGIDRVDSAVGYTLDNCVACCYSCNKAKSSLSLPEFLALIEKIYMRLLAVK